MSKPSFPPGPRWSVPTACLDEHYAVVGAPPPAPAPAPASDCTPVQAFTDPPDVQGHPDPVSPADVGLDAFVKAFKASMPGERRAAWREWSSRIRSTCSRAS